MLGLIAAAHTACGSTCGSSSDDPETGGGAGGETSDDKEGTGGSGGASETDDEEPAKQGILSSKIVADLSLEDFTELCQEAGGVVETHAACGGANTGPGFSYDDATDVCTEHPCPGYNPRRGRRRRGPK